MVASFDRWIDLTQPSNSEQVAKDAMDRLIGEHQEMMERLRKQDEITVIKEVEV